MMENRIVLIMAMHGTTTKNSILVLTSFHGSFSSLTETRFLSSFYVIVGVWKCQKQEERGGSASQVSS